MNPSSTSFLRVVFSGGIWFWIELYMAFGMIHELVIRNFSSKRMLCEPTADFEVGNRRSVTLSSIVVEGGGGGDAERFAF